MNHPASAQFPTNPEDVEDPGRAGGHERHAEVDKTDEHQDAVHDVPAGAEVAVVAVQQVMRYHLRRSS